MNVWEDDGARAAVKQADRRKLLVLGLLSEACVTFAVLTVIADGYEVYVVGDACGGLTAASHDLALRRMEKAGAHMSSWIQVLLKLQRDWTRHATYDGARAIVEDHGGGYGIGLACGRDMIHPTKAATKRSNALTVSRSSLANRPHEVSAGITRTAGRMDSGPDGLSMR